MVVYRAAAAPGAVRWPYRLYRALAAPLVSLWVHRRVLGALARHDLRASYAGTVGGVAWAVVGPLVPLLVLTAVFAAGLRLPMRGAPYLLGFATAYVPWTLLAASLTGAAGSIPTHRYLVKRVPFPVEVIPASAILTQACAHVCLLALAVAACAVGGHVRPGDLLLVPYFFGCAAVLAIGLGQIVAALAVVARDVVQLLPSFLHVWFWLTPIAWSSDRLPAPAQALMALNPASYVVAGYRHALMPASFSLPTPRETAIFWAMTAAVLALSSACFGRLRPHFWTTL
ncbi:MAG: ABC transporter permease [Gemmatirosa sp.]|nr:ABC transporter permease [Gemmatirosa sp.]